MAGRLKPNRYTAYPFLPIHTQEISASRTNEVKNIPPADSR